MEQAKQANYLVLHEEFMLREVTTNIWAFAYNVETRKAYILLAEKPLGLA
jgi:hypothetical protein